jgi:hypothetical protein
MYVVWLEEVKLNLSRERRTSMEELMTGLKFKYVCFKLKCKHKKVVKLRLKGLKLCLQVINKVGFPVNKEEAELLNKALTTYDEILEELKNDVDSGRLNMELYEGKYGD